MASAKLANITVRKSQTVTDQLNTAGCAIASINVTTVPTSTTNITGLRICTLGVSFRNAVDQGPAQDLAVEEAPRLRHAVRQAGSGWSVGSCWSLSVIRRTFRG